MINRIDQEKQKYETYLEQSRLKFTDGRRFVFKKVIGAHGHFCAEELAKKCRVGKEQVSRATVYRILRELLEAGVIRETAYGHKHQVFEHIYDEQPHHHARCIKCGLMIELSDQGEETPYQKELDNHLFHVLGHELSFYGICKKCQDQSSTN